MIISSGGPTSGSMTGIAAAKASQAANKVLMSSILELEPLGRPTSRSKEDMLRPTSSRSKGKEKLAPIQRP